MSKRTKKSYPSQHSGRKEGETKARKGAKKLSRLHFTTHPTKCEPETKSTKKTKKSKTNRESKAGKKSKEAKEDKESKKRVEPAETVKWNTNFGSL